MKANLCVMSVQAGNVQVEWVVHDQAEAQSWQYFASSWEVVLPKTFDPVISGPPRRLESTPQPRRSPAVQQCVQVLVPSARALLLAHLMVQHRTHCDGLVRTSLKY